MKLDFILNDYLLMWHLLYESSVSEEIHNIKQVLWKDYKKEYSTLYKEKDKILNDLDNYIPDDDFIFNIFETSPSYKKVIKETNKYRMSLLQLCDLNGKLYKKEVDFVAKKRDTLIYIQVSDNISDETTFEREYSPLLAIRDAYPKMVIARTHHETYDYQGVQVVDICRWLRCR